MSDENITGRVDVGESDVTEYAHLVEEAEDGLYMMDESGRFTIVNEAFVELTGYEREEIIGSCPTLLLEDEALQRVNEQIRTTRRTGDTSGSMLTTLVAKSGQQKPVEIRFSLLPSEETYRGLTGVVRDVRARRHREQKLDVLSRVLRHNVRNKVNLIVGHASIVQDADDDRYQGAAESIEQAAQSLMQLSEKARTAQTEVGFNPADEGQTDLAELLEHLAVQFRRDYPHARLKTNLPQELITDTPKSYRIAVSELLENAIEHNPDDEPGVTVKLEENDDEEIRTIVEDECPPIPNTDRQAINEGKETPLVHSIGIGLWLANWVADTVNGKLELERREDDEGNRATIVIRQF
jgi:PAS domain S-box-containing protein